ncbi:Phosphate-selective porin O and P [Desulfurobacterium pacificum]|uniref:Phosphate-selective porin O and P n=1 Tax=Desulfurobacterium pacificum TaxID=240166 RepID=A0ABY1NL60_9BACT|nr:porin [Desulfurobacterium pacificum]SMP12576.1 Phosphate-selective porin O and P [Desulfurobacterium pacificum]
MKKFLSAATVFMVTVGLASASVAQDYSMDEIMQKLQQLEQKVAQLEAENEALRASKGVRVVPRKRTKKLTVKGRVLLRATWDKRDEIVYKSDGSINTKDFYGDTPNSMIVRKARVQFQGKLNRNFSYKIHIRADRGTGVRLWDAFVDYKFDAIPLKLRMGQQKIPVSLSYLRPGPKIKFPERPIVVRDLDSHDRDVGVRAIFKPMKGLQLEAAVMNGEGVKQDEDDLKNKIGNIHDKRYSYVFAVDAKPVNTDVIGLRVRAAYQTGYAYLYYTSANAKRNLFDIEASANIKPVGLILEGGYSRDNPSHVVKTDGTPETWGNAKGYYVQADYKVPIEALKNLHLLARYSYDNINTDASDAKKKVASYGFYYLLDGWQAAIRTAYVVANQGTDTGKDDDRMLVTELQLLF